MTPARLKSLSDDLLDSLFDTTRSQRLRYIEEAMRDLVNEIRDDDAKVAEEWGELSVAQAIRAKRLPDSEGT